MRRIELIRELRRHCNLASKRSPLYAKNKLAKYMWWIVEACVAAYLVFLAVLFALIVIEENEATPTGMFTLMPFIFCIDFLLRFIVQQTPTQMVRPYLLLPVPKYACIDSFILTQTFSLGNFMWQFLFLPYAVMTIVFREGVVPAIGFVLACQVVIFLSTHLYMFVRTRLHDHLLWAVVPVMAAAVIFSPYYIMGDLNFDRLADTYAAMGTSLSHFNPLYWIPLLAILAVMVFINRREQYAHIMTELSSDKKTTIRHISQFGFFNRFGFVGKYIQLEIKLILRNKHPRNQMILISAIVSLFIISMCFGMYQDSFSQEFWCMYAFIMLGGGLLQRIMMYEGNYIDFLMTHQENIYSLLIAKYYFYSAMLLLPAVVCLPVVIFGNWTVLQCTAYLLYTCGPIYFMIFQLAVYNNQTLALDASLMTRTHVDNQGVQTIGAIIALMLPIFLCLLIKSLFNATFAHLTLIVVSIPFIATHRLWLKNVYHRMMKRRYKNLEAFHQTR